MPSFCLGKITIDFTTLKNEFLSAGSLPYTDTYKEFICGRWRSCALWNASGLDQDVTMKDYIGIPKQTQLSFKLPYLSRLIKEKFNFKELKFARLVALEPNSIVLPHRDYLELENPMTRVHLPLFTDTQCFNSEENSVFHLGEGEVWYLDVSIIHSAASFSQKTRIHLVLDFDARTPLENIYPYCKGYDQESVSRYRPELSKKSKDGMLDLSYLINTYNFNDILAILAKQHFFSNFSLSDFYKYLDLISEKSGDAAVIEKKNWLIEYCITSREAA